MTGLADVDRFKICIQDFMLPGFWPMNMKKNKITAQGGSTVTCV